jgi:hypothetical protein
MATTATIGFAHNHKGQALINSLNRSPNSTALGNWLETSFPYLDGVSSSHNLTSATNSTVTVLVRSSLERVGQKTDAWRAHWHLMSRVRLWLVDGTHRRTDSIFHLAARGAKTYNVALRHGDRPGGQYVLHPDPDSQSGESGGQERDVCQREEYV